MIGQHISTGPVPNARWARTGSSPGESAARGGRVGLTVLTHTLDLQRLGLAAAHAGWTDWQLGDRLDKWQAGQSRPDEGNHLANREKGLVGGNHPSQQVSSSPGWTLQSWLPVAREAF